MIFIGYAEDKNELLKSYDPSKPKIWVIGVDGNNLYQHSAEYTFPAEYFIGLIQKTLIYTTILKISQ